MPRRSRRPRPSRAGLTLLETAVLLSVVGVVVAAFLPTFLREVRLSKVSEAGDNLRELHRRAAAYYGERHRVDDVGRRTHCVPAPAGPAPALPSEDPVPVDFESAQTPGHATWRALGFSPSHDVRFRYTLRVEPEAGCGPRPEGEVVQLRFIAEGDLDGDGVLSHFELRASNAEDPDVLAPVGPLRTHRRVE